MTLFFGLKIQAEELPSSPQFLVVLGIAQDAGYPHIGNAGEFRQVTKNARLQRKVVSLGLVDKFAKQKWLFEATPDMSRQLFILNNYLPTQNTLPGGIFLTHGISGITRA